MVTVSDAPADAVATGDTGAAPDARAFETLKIIQNASAHSLLCSSKEHYAKVFFGSGNHQNIRCLFV